MCAYNLDRFLFDLLSKEEKKTSKYRHCDENSNYLQSIVDMVAVKTSSKRMTEVFLHFLRIKYQQEKKNKDNRSDASASFMINKNLFQIIF